MMFDYAWIVLALSMLGALLTSGKSKRFRMYGFGVWMISNGAIGIGYYHQENYVMALLFLGGYQIFNLRGVISNYK